MIGAALTLVLSVPSFSLTGFAWQQGQFPIPYCISANATGTSLTQAQQRTLITNAVNFWRSTGGGGGTSCTTYDAAPAAYSCARTIDLGDGKNNIYFERNWQWGSQTLGVTHSGGVGNCGSVRDNTGQTVRMTCQGYPDIELNDAGLTWDDGGRRGNTDLTSIVTHEYGHFLGLDHCNDNNTCQFGTAVMYAAYGGGTMYPPRADDTAGVCALYPGTPGGVGFPCTNNNACNSRLCVSPASGGYCTASCGTCPAGYACDTLAGFMGTVCVRDDGLNRDTCEECQGGVANACAGNGLCIAGIPEAQSGRCAPPCPNPAAPDGGCPNLFTCVQIRGAGDYCIPRSNDCTNLNNFTELQFGQNCSAGTAQCASGLECIDICTRACTGTGQGSCPANFVCDEFQFQTGPASYCAPPVNEGQSCSGFVSCTAGPCLNAGGGATCYKDCTGNPNACNNAQDCNTYQLQGGGSVSICEPAGVPPNPPRPDAGVPPGADGGTPPPPADGGVNPPRPDAEACACDTSFACEPGCGCDPECQPDAGSAPPAADASAPPTSCACDLYTHCEPGCDCDTDCPCNCDLTTVCDPNCTCDPECYGGGDQPPTTPSDCTTAGGADGMALFAVVAALALAKRGRRRDLATEPS